MSRSLPPTASPMTGPRWRCRRASSASASCRCERYDIALCRRDYFEPPLQKLLGFGRTPAFARRGGTRRLRDRRPGPVHHDGR
jgi:hypothetical protein